MLHAVVLFIVLTLFNISLGWFVNHVILDVFEWFNDIHWGFKLLILMFGGVTIFLTITGIYELLVRLLGGLIFSLFPVNWFTIGITVILCLLNAGQLIYSFWDIIDDWGFWIVVEFVIVCGFILSLHMAFFPMKEE